MMKDAREHKFDIILVKRISRLIRNTMLVLDTLKELKDLGMSELFEKESIDTGASYFEMLLTIIESLCPGGEPQYLREGEEGPAHEGTKGRGELDAPVWLQKGRRQGIHHRPRGSGGHKTDL